MTSSLPRRIAWFAPWTWKRSAQIGLTIGLVGIAVVATLFNVLLYGYMNHAID